MFTGHQHVNFPFLMTPKRTRGEMDDAFCISQTCHLILTLDARKHLKS